MIPKSFDEITKADIEALIDEQVPESKTIEYKRTLPVSDTEGKKEFLADVSAFANASGGDIIFGLCEVDDAGEKTGAAAKLHPIDASSADDEIRRLEQTIHSGLEPRLLVQTRYIPGWGDDSQCGVIVMRIPNSFASPHMVTFRGGSRFFVRNSAGKHQLDVHELRTAFLATDMQAERVRQFRQDRLAKVIAGETPVSLANESTLVLHIIPLTALLGRQLIDLSDRQLLVEKFAPMKSGSNFRYNLDGFLTHYERYDDAGKSRSYSQVFSNGVLEVVDSDVVSDSDSGGIPLVNYEGLIVQTVEACFEAYKVLGLDEPTAISLALLGCRGQQLHAEGYVFHDPEKVIDRDFAVFPEVIAESPSSNIPSALRPLFDGVWNAFGYARSLSYDDTGEWNPR